MSLHETSITLFGYNLQQHENPYIPRLFSPGSALVFNKGERWYLLGISLRSENHLRTRIRSVEKLTKKIDIKQQCTSHQSCSDGYYCLPASCDQRLLCLCSSEDYINNCGSSGNMTRETCQESGNHSSSSEEPLPKNPKDSESPSVTDIETLRTAQKTNQYKEPEGSLKPSTKSPQGSTTTTSRTDVLANYGDSMGTMGSTMKCPPIDLGPLAQNVDLSCRFQNGTRAGLLCSEQFSEIGSKAILTCADSDNYLKTMCSSTGIWDPPIAIHCIPGSIKLAPEDSQEVAGGVKCPEIELHEGIEISCSSGDLIGSGDDCIKAALPNTTAMLKCKPFYIPLKDSTLEKTCDSSGTWLPRKSFACAIDCGITDGSKLPFIVHGSKIPSEVWPWHAALFFNVNGTNKYLCGGTLISRSILVTAAHCVEKATRRSEYQSLYKVAVGAISSSYIINLKDEQTQMFEISNVTINPHYNNRSYEGDIALIRLSKPVTLSEFVRPVCFPFPTEKNTQLERYQLSEGNYGYVVGFGTDESWMISPTLKMAKIPYISVRQCTRVLERQPTISQYRAGYTNGTSVCEGDSGGGMFFQDESSPRRFYIQGVVSHGNRDFINARCDNEKYSVFTRVGAFNDWVKSVVDLLEFDYQ